MDIQFKPFLQITLIKPTLQSHQLNFKNHTTPNQYSLNKIQIKPNLPNFNLWLKTSNLLLLPILYIYKEILLFYAPLSNQTKPNFP